MIFWKGVFYYEEKKKDSKRNFYSDLFIFDNISGGVVCIWENRDSGSRLYMSVCTACLFGGVAAIQE